MSFAPIPKGRARNHCNPFFSQQALTELLTAQTCTANGWEYIKSSLGLEALQSYAIEFPHQIFSTHIIFVPHGLDFLITAAESLYCGQLAGRRSTHDGKLMNLGHLTNQWSRTYRISQSPPSHGIGFGKTIHYNGAFTHPLNRGNGDMFFSTIGQFGINLIRQNQYIGLPQNFCNGLEIPLLHNAAGGVVGVWENQQLAPGVIAP